LVAGISLLIPVHSRVLDKHEGHDDHTATILNFIRGDGTRIDAIELEETVGDSAARQHNPERQGQAFRDADQLRAVVADLREQRTRLYEEVARLKRQRNDAITAATVAQGEIASLQDRVRELEGSCPMP
jgi:hypothetical protein